MLMRGGFQNQCSLVGHAVCVCALVVSLVNAVVVVVRLRIAPGWKRCLLFFPFVLLNVLLPTIVWKVIMSVCEGEVNSEDDGLLSANTHITYKYAGENLATTAWISWIANTKLILLALGSEPYNSLMTNRPLLCCAAIALVIALRQHEIKNGKRQKENGDSQVHAFSKSEEKVNIEKDDVKTQSNESVAQMLRELMLWSACMVTLIIMYRSLEAAEYFPLAFVISNKNRILRFIGSNVFLSILASSLFLNAAIGITLGLNCVRPFCNPYSAVSLSDFWARKWNLLVSKLLKDSVYKQIMRLSSNTRRRVQLQFVSVIMTFLVSALMHELIILHVDYRFGGKFLIFFFLHAMGVIGEQLIPNRLKSRIHKSFSQYAWSYCLCRVLQFLYVFIFTYGTAELYFIGPVFGIRLPEWLYESLMYLEENMISFSLFTRQGLQISKSELRI